MSGTPRTINNRQEEINTFLAKYFLQKEEPTPPPARAQPVGMDDRELLEKAMASKNGAKFKLLFHGDWQGAGYFSQSEADLALCNHLAFWTGRGAGRMDRLFRQSGLFRKKWDTKHFADGRTYGQAVIEEASKNTVEVYTPGRKDRPKNGRGRASCLGNYQPRWLNTTCPLSP